MSKVYIEPSWIERILCPDRLASALKAVLTNSPQKKLLIDVTFATSIQAIKNNRIQLSISKNGIVRTRKGKCKEIVIVGHVKDFLIKQLYEISPMIEPSPTIIENLLSAKYKDIVVVNALEQGLSLTKSENIF